MSIDDKDGSDRLEGGMDRVIVDRMIGQGKFSEVYLGHYDGKMVAVKSVHDMTNFREVKLLRTVNHPNVTKLIDAVLNEGLVHIIMELCMGGSLFDQLHVKKPGCVVMSWSQRMRICVGVADAMMYLHGCNPPIIHRDLKSLNLLLAAPIKNNTDMPIIKVADLGLAREFRWTDAVGTSSKSLITPTDRSSLTMQVGTVQWMAPELVQSPAYTVKVDVYSFAIVLYEIAFRRVPFADMNVCDGGELLRMVVQGLRPDTSQLPDGCPEELAALMKVCWNQAPSTRPSFKRILPWLKMVIAEKGYNTWNISL